MNDDTLGKPRIEFYRASGTYGFLSNLYRCNLYVAVPTWVKDEIRYRSFTSSEQAYQFAKSSNPDVREDIALVRLPRSAAALGHGMYRFDVVPEWTENKVEWMRTVVRAKFHDNPELAEKLLATGDAILIEASKTDAFWGIGKKGTGKNMLGVILMEVRSELQGRFKSHRDQMMLETNDALGSHQPV